MHIKIHALKLYTQIYCIHCSFRVLNFMLPTSERNFAQVSRNTWKAEQTWRVESLDLAGKIVNSHDWELKYCPVHKQSFENEWLYIARNMTIILQGMREQRKEYHSL
jgi:hypothetical protein